MSYATPAPQRVVPVEQLDLESRLRFLSRVYGHLGVALGLFIALEIAVFMSGFNEAIIDFIAEQGTLGLLVIFGGVMAGSWIANTASFSDSVGTQYLGLAGVAVVWALLFAVPLTYAFDTGQGGDVWAAAVISAIAFAGLTVIGMTSRKDFSFLGALVKWGMVLGFAMIVASILFGFYLGLWFSLLMVGIAGGAILWQTQAILRQFPEDKYVGAAVSLFGSVMLMFYYLLRIFTSRN